MSFIYLCVLVVYLSIMLAIGFFFYRFNKGVSDYVIGGRTLNPWLAALSAQASDMSGWLLLGLPGTAYLLYIGTTEAIWTAVGLCVGTAFNWMIVARRLRYFTGKLNALTLPDYFEKRFQDKSGLLRIFSALFILVFFLFYTASMFSAGAKLFQSVFGISYTPALLIGAAIIISYTFLGGFMAVCWTDFIQGTLLLALLITPVIGWWHLNSETLSATPEITANVFQLFPKTGTGTIDFLLLASALGWGLGYFGQPHILPRFIAIRSEKDVYPATVIALIWVVLALTASVLCGVIGAKCYPGLGDPETVFIVMAQHLFSPVVAGILMTAILSAIMSTADSQLLVASSAVSVDWYQKTACVSEKATLRVSRISVIVIPLLAIVLVLVENPTPGTLLYRINENIFRLVAFAWAGFGAAFGPLVLFSVFWRRTTRNGALAGMVVGALIAFFWRLNVGGIFDIYELLPGFFASALVIVIVSLLGKRPVELESLFDTK